MRTKHDSDAAFERWVTSGDGEDILRTHTVQAGFREGWNAAVANAVQMRRLFMGAASDAHVLRKHPPYGSSFLDCDKGPCPEYRVALDLKDALVPAPAQPDPNVTFGAGFTAEEFVRGLRRAFSCLPSAHDLFQLPRSSSGARKRAAPAQPEQGRCPHGHVGCCGHHDAEDMPVHPTGCRR